MWRLKHLDLETQSKKQKSLSSPSQASGTLSKPNLSNNFDEFQNEKIESVENYDALETNSQSHIMDNKDISISPNFSLKRNEKKEASQNTLIGVISRQRQQNFGSTTSSLKRNDNNTQQNIGNDFKEAEKIDFVSSESSSSSYDSEINPMYAYDKKNEKSDHEMIESSEIEEEKFTKQNAPEKIDPILSDNEFLFQKDDDVQKKKKNSFINQNNLNQNRFYENNNAENLQENIETENFDIAITDNNIVLKDDKIDIDDSDDNDNENNNNNNNNIIENNNNSFNIDGDRINNDENNNDISNNCFSDIDNDDDVDNDKGNDENKLNKMLFQQMISEGSDLSSEECISQQDHLFGEEDSYPLLNNEEIDSTVAHDFFKQQRVVFELVCEETSELDVWLFDYMRILKVRKVDSSVDEIVDDVYRVLVRSADVSHVRNQGDTFVMGMPYHIYNHKDQVYLIAPNVSDKYY